MENDTTPFADARLHAEQLHVQQLLVGYHLGALDAASTDRAETLLAASPEALREYFDIKRHFDAARPDAPPARAKRRLMSLVRRPTPVPTWSARKSSRARPDFSWLALASGLSVALVLLVLSYERVPWRGDGHAVPTLPATAARVDPPRSRAAGFSPASEAPQGAAAAVIAHGDLAHGDDEQRDAPLLLDAPGDALASGIW